jgi:hypothetical protein
MTVHRFEPDDPLGVALEEIGKLAGYVSPVLIVHGTDAAGISKVGTLDLHISQDMTFQQKLHQTAAVGTFAATLRPYFTRLDELYYINKSVLDLQKLGRGTEEVFIISHVEVAANEFTTKVFTLLHDTSSSIKGVRVVTMQAESLGVATALPYQLLKAFMKSYRNAEPKNHAN